MKPGRNAKDDGDAPSYWGWPTSMQLFNKPQSKTRRKICKRSKTKRMSVASKIVVTMGLIYIAALTLFAIASLCSSAFGSERGEGRRAPGEIVAPPRGWSLPIEVMEVYDGDTLTVELRMRARVRLLDCWAPELKDEGGPASKAKLGELCRGEGRGARGVLFVPLQRDGRLDKHFTFGRLLGHIWLDGDDADLATQMVEAGHATREKAK
jgi:endonuclease YncB( thermonuclease family)